MPALLLAIRFNQVILMPCRAGCAIQRNFVRVCVLHVLKGGKWCTISSSNSVGSVI